MDSYISVPKQVVGWATPSMTDYSDDEGDVLYSSEYSTSYKGWYALDHDRGTAWISLEADGAPSVGTPQYIGFQFAAAKTIRGFSFITRNSANHDHPKDFTLQGSNNGSDWDILHTVTVIAPPEVEIARVIAEFMGFDLTDLDELMGISISDLDEIAGISTS